MKMLDDEARDALAEAFNMALGEAAAALADIVQEEIETRVPALELLSRDALLRQLPGLQAPGDAPRLCRIGQRYRHPGQPGGIEAVLLLPEQGSLIFVRRMLGDLHPAAGPLSELEQDALAELGNLLINRAMQRLSRVLGCEMLGGLPEWRSAAPADVLGSDADGPAHLLVAHVGLQMRTRELRGRLLFLMDAPALDAAIGQIRRYFGLEALETL